MSTMPLIQANPDLAYRLDSMVEQLFEAVRAANRSLKLSATCLFGDDDACNSVAGQIRDLEERSTRIAERVEAAKFSTVLTSDEVRAIDVHVDNILSALAYTGQAGDISLTTIEIFSKDTLEALAEYVGAAVKVVGEGLGEGLAGLSRGIGPLGLLVIAGLIYVYARGRAA